MLIRQMDEDRKSFSMHVVGYLTSNPMTKEISSKKYPKPRTVCVMRVKHGITTRDDGAFGGKIVRCEAYNKRMVEIMQSLKKGEYVEVFGYDERNSYMPPNAVEAYAMKCEGIIPLDRIGRLSAHYDAMKQYDDEMVRRTRAQERERGVTYDGEAEKTVDAEF